MASSTERSRRCRARRQAGLALYMLELDPVATSEMLIDQELLPAWDAEDRGAVGRALSRLIYLLIAKAALDKA